MELPSLFLLKMGILAGLSWLSYRKARRLVQRQQVHRNHLEAVLTEIPAADALSKEEDASTAGSTSSTPSQEEYCSVYYPFLTKGKQNEATLEVSQHQEANNTVEQHISQQEETPVVDVRRGRFDFRGFVVGGRGCGKKKKIMKR